MASAALVGGAGDALIPTRLSLAVGLNSMGLAAIALAGALWSDSADIPGEESAGVVELLGLSRGRLSTAQILLLAIGTIGASHLLDVAIDTIGLREGSVLVSLEDTIARGRGLGWLALALGLAIAPSVGEELLFRGFVLRRAAAQYGLWAGVTLSSVLFGLMHLDFAQSPAAILLGFYLGGVAVAAGSTRAAIVCHVANNLAVLVATGLGAGGGGVSVALALLAACIGCSVLARALRA